MNLVLISLLGFVSCQTVTVTVNTCPTPTATPFDCNSQSCSHFASCINGACQCPLGFGGPDCSSLTCGSPFRNNPPLKDSNSTSCSCDNGFTGINCLACQSDDACSATSGSATLEKKVCNKLPKVWVSSTTYCDAVDPLLQSFYPGTVALMMNRNRTASTMLGSLFYNGLEQFTCQMTDCTQIKSGDSYTYSCQSTKCSCIPKSTFCGGTDGVVAITGAIEDLKGEFTFNCPNGGFDNCKINFKSLSSFFPDGLSVKNCVSGECAFPSQEPADNESSTLSVLSPLAVVGIAASSLLVLLIVVSLAVGIVQRIKLRNLPPAPNRAGAYIKFKNVGYKVKHKQVLEKVSGYACPGRVLAILGPSGAGKSTLLDILAGKRKSGSVAGEITMNGKSLRSQGSKSLIGFVDQEDVLMDAFTVKEALMFSAELRLPESISFTEKAKIVNDTIETLGLSHVANSRIGGNGVRGISGGEKRRVSIGIELVTSPSVLYLDEPTSGLDSYNAFMVVKTLSSLARDHNKTIVFTIHQPRSDVYQLFDDVLVLAKGDVLYMGEGKAAGDYMASKNIPCPAGYNIADHLLDVAVTRPQKDQEIADMDAKEGQTLRNRKSKLVAPNQQDDHEQSDDCSETISNSSIKVLDIQVEPQEFRKDRFAMSWITQLIQLSTRSFKMLLRKPSLLLGHIAVSVLLGLFVGALYWKIENTMAGFQNRAGSVFFMLILIGFSSLSAIGTFTNERILFLRERSNGFYGPIPFFLSKVFFDIIPLRIIPTMLLGTIAYYMIGYNSQIDYYVRYICILLLFSAICGLFCLAIGCIFEDYSTAILIAAISMLFELLMAGTLINQKNIPEYLRWIQYLSFCKYANEAIVINVAGDRIKDTFNGMEVNIPSSFILAEIFGFDIASYWKNFLVLLGIMVGFLGVILLLIIFRLKERR